MKSSLQETIDLQQIASNPNNSCWVFASAGSGKTKILTDRVLRLLLNGVAADKILCLTFTKVAAAEMQQRINSELAKWSLIDEKELEKIISNLNQKKSSQAEISKARNLFLELLDYEEKIKIQTIHAFCQGILKAFPFESKVRANFEILEESQEKLLLKKSRQNIIDKSLENNELKNLLTELSARTSEEGFDDLVAEFLQKKDKFLHAKEVFFGIENLCEEIFSKLKISQNQTEENIFAKFVKNCDLAKLNLFEKELRQGKSSKNLESAQSIKLFLEQPIYENFAELKSAFLTQENTPKKFYDQISKNENQLIFAGEFSANICQFLEEINSLKIAQNSCFLARYIDLVLENYQSLKNNGGFLDYDDIITKAENLLNNPEFKDWVRMKIDGSFDHILVDESQDTNRKQWNIIKALSDDFFSGESASAKKRSIFIVGDEKQSIYGFQGAENDISSEIFEYFWEKSDQKLLKIELTNSFRSQPKILQAVDEVFNDSARQKSISQISEFKGHKAIKNGEGIVEIWPQIKNQESKKDEKSYDWNLAFEQIEQDDEAEILAKIIAKRIRDKVDDNSAKYGDFMILLRNRTNALNGALTRIFDECEIPFSSIGAIHFKKNLLLQDLVSLAQFIVLPQDDLNLACLLKSPFFEISEEDLIEICSHKNSHKINIFNSLAQIKKYQKFHEQLLNFLFLGQKKSSFELFYFLLKEQNFEKKFIQNFGNEANKIIDKFLIALYDFCQNSATNLQKFLEFIAKFDAKISLTSQDQNSVKITTIHSAKGLQAPVVIMPDCCYNFNKLLTSKEKISWIKGPKIELPLWRNGKDEENSLLQKHREEKISTAKDEYLRLLYVAMTRAENELYIGGFGKSKDQNSWYEIIKNSVTCAQNLEFSNLVGSVKKRAIEHLAEKEEQFSPIQNLKNNDKKEDENEPHSQINPNQIKGRLLHKLMEIIGKNHQAKQNWLLFVAHKLIAKEQFLGQEKKEEIYFEIEKFLTSEDFKKIFGNKIYCEVEIKGNNQFNLQRVDLIVEKDEEILIIDYKSDEETNQIPQKYIHQLTAYKNSLEKIYPNKPIKTAIMWLKDIKITHLN